MHHPWLSCLCLSALAIFFLPASSCAQVDEDESQQTIPLEYNENGNPIVEVTLSNHGEPATFKVFRFLLDTGASKTVLDLSVPPDYFWTDSNTICTIKDAFNNEAETASIIIKAIELGGISRDAIAAVRMDLKTGMLGNATDRPVDGILGINFLHGTRFTLDPKKKCMTWWGSTPKNGAIVPMFLGNDGCPYVRIMMGKTEFITLVDTGDPGSLCLPKEYKPRGVGRKIFRGGALSTKLNTGTEIIIPKITADSHAWTKIPVTFMDSQSPQLGQEILSSAPVTFDFVGLNLIFSLNPNGDLPFNNKLHMAAMLMWDRSATPARLIVHKIKSGMVLEKAGFKAGDQIIRADNLEGPSLSRRSVIMQLRTSGTHQWIVRRGNKVFPLQFVVQ